MKHFIRSLVVATFMTTASYMLGLHFKWIENISWLEAFSVFTSYSCTYLCVVQSRINYIVGFVSVSALCALFYTQGLYSSMALQVYLFGALVYGWFRWGPDKQTRKVTRLAFNWWLAGYALITSSTYAFCFWVTSLFGANLPIADSAILVLSIFAQFLLDNKKIETWFVWIAVNVISVWLYWTTDLKVLAIQMGLFGFNAVWALYEWRKTMKAAPAISPEIDLSPDLPPQLKQARIAGVL